MTVPDLDKRIEAAARELVPNFAYKSGERVESRMDARLTASKALHAAFPELFDGSSWLAPWEASEEMLRPPPWHENSAEAYAVKQDYAMLRDAHIAKTEGR